MGKLWTPGIIGVTLLITFVGCLGTFQPLDNAVQNQDVYTVRVLLDEGANVNVQNMAGWTPLMRAAYIGNVNITKLLLERGADPLIKNKAGETARMIAESLDHTLVADILKEAERGTAKK